MLKWEQIPQSDQLLYMHRAKIFGGWLVQCTVDALTPQYQGYDIPNNEAGYQWRTSLAFVPDPNHEWTLNQ